MPSKSKRVRINIYPVTLYLKEAFTISRGSYSERKAVIVELSAAGKIGYGEASEHAYYGIDRDEMLQLAKAVIPVIERYSFDNPSNFWRYLKPHIGNNPFLQCAIDNAAHDLYGNIGRQPCHKQWGLKAEDLIKTSYTLSIDSIDKMVEKLKTTNFDIYKIKLGTPDDMAILRALRQHSKALFRVDANCAWTVEQTIRFSKEMKDLGVEFIEQPLPADDWEGMKEVYEKSALPIIADEACSTEDMVPIAAKHFHGINIKLMKCGGLTPALRMIDYAKTLGLKVMVGCMVESSVGCSAIAQLLPLLDYVDMDGALLLADDPATGAEVLADGAVVLPERNGLGIEMK